MKDLNNILYNSILINMKDRTSIPVSIPKGLVKQIDHLVEKGIFSSRSDAIRFGVRLVAMIEKRTHERAEEYAYEDIIEGLKRGK